MNRCHKFEFFFPDFLLRYFGPLEVEQKKVHISLVGCVRNERGAAKKQKLLSNTVHEDALDGDIVDQVDRSYEHHY